MAPPRLYSPPHLQLAELLAAARARGLSFVEAWDEAFRPGKAVVMSNMATAPVGALRWPSDRSDRLAWQAALLESRDGWRRAYEREEPTRPERAVTNLADSIGALDQVAALRARDEGIARVPAVASAA